MTTHDLEEISRLAKFSANIRPEDLRDIHPGESDSRFDVVLGGRWGIVDLSYQAGLKRSGVTIIDEF